MKNKELKVPEIRQYSQRYNHLLNGKHYWSFYYFIIRKLQIQDYEVKIGWRHTNDKYKQHMGVTFIDLVEDERKKNNDIKILQLVFSYAKPSVFSLYIPRIINAIELKKNEEMFLGIWEGEPGSDAGADISRDGTEWCFGYADWSSQCSVYISYVDGINLFYNYFKAFEIYVDQYMGSPTSEEKWYLEFKKELPNLEVIYKDLVERGEIVEVKQPAVG